MRSRVVLLALVAAVAVLVAGCGSSGSTSADAAIIAPLPAATDTAPGIESARRALTEGRSVIDVRTDEEVAAGAVPGALHLDVSRPDFATRILELDSDDAYVVYCRTGNRSVAATAMLRDAGFDVLDGGGLTSMADAGYTIG